MSAPNQKSAFASYFLDDIAAWVGVNMSPNQVFTPEQLRAEVAANDEPEQVFAPSILGQWAEANGYEKVTP